MRTFLFFCLAALLPNLSHAKEPANMCYRNSCSAPQLEIWNEFLNNKYIPAAELSPSVYSGVCYHSAADFDNTHPHYAVTYLADGSDGQTHFSGIFGFFYQTDPWADWNVDEARKQFPNHDTPNHLIVPDGHSGMIDFSSEDTLWAYWLRLSPDLNHLYIVAYWSVRHSVFCDLTRHDGATDGAGTRSNTLSP
jgi:hypothetical protein